VLGNRLDESRVISEFLASARWPAALLLEGEAGIGKTTQWLSVIDQAGALGIRVLAARTAAAESVLAYASLADLLGDVEAAVLADLPGPQRMAMDRVLLRGTGDDDEATDPRAVAAGFVSVVERLADESPVIIAIDDLQWLDTSSPAGGGVRRAAARGADRPARHRAYRAAAQCCGVVAPVAEG